MSDQNIIYIKETCPYCAKAKQLLQQKNISFEEVSLISHPERRQEMIEKSGGRTTVPQVFLQGKHIGGCDDLFALYEKDGKLI